MELIKAGYQRKAGQLLWWIRCLRSLIHPTPATNVTLQGGLREATRSKSGKCSALGFAQK